MKYLLVAYLLFFSTQSFATGPDNTTYEAISTTVRELVLPTSSLKCYSWPQQDARAMVHLTGLGLSKESIDLDSLIDNCDSVDEIKRCPKVKAEISQILYLETPINWVTGEPTGEPSYYSCVTNLSFKNGLIVYAWYWNPQDMTACK